MCYLTTGERREQRTRDGVHGDEVVGRPEVVVVGAEVRVRGGRASVLELSVAVVVHAVVPLANKDTGVVLVLFAEAELIILVVEGVLDVTPLL